MHAIDKQGNFTCGDPAVSKPQRAFFYKAPGRPQSAIGGLTGRERAGTPEIAIPARAPGACDPHSM